MDNNEIKKKFFRFLKENGVFTSFKKNFVSHTQLRIDWCKGSYKDSTFSVKEAASFNDYANNLKEKKNLISWAFSWKDTKEGHSFWDMLSCRWANSLKS
jgi:hypothetical protein